MKPLIGATIVLVVLALSLLLSVLVAQGMTSWIRAPSVVKVYTYKYADTAGLTTLYVNDTHGAISVSEWSQNYVYVNATLTRILYPISVNASVNRVGSTLDILVHQPHTPLTFIGYYTLSLDILIPESLHALVVHAFDVDGSVYLTLKNFTSVKVYTVNGDIHLKLGSGSSVSASSVNGAIALTSSTVRAFDLTTVNGGISVEFVPTSEGVYRALSTNGDIRVAVPINSSLSVTMTTTNGALSVNGLQLANMSATKNTLTGTLGKGSATLTLSTTNGNILLTSAKSFTVNQNPR